MARRYGMGRVKWDFKIKMADSNNKADFKTVLTQGEVELRSSKMKKTAEKLIEVWIILFDAKSLFFNL